VFCLPAAGRPDKNPPQSPLSERGEGEAPKGASRGVVPFFIP